MFWIGKGAPPKKDWVETWWNPYIGPIENQLTKTDMRILSEASAIAYLDNNISEVWDMYFFEEEIAKSLSKFGIKTYIGEAIMTNPPTGYKGLKAIEETERLIKKFKNHKLIKPVVGYIGPYDWASDIELTKASAELAIKYKIPVHTHGAGNQGDFEDCKRVYGMTPIETIEHFGFFSKEIPETVIVHCAVLNDKEIDILKKYKEKVKIAVCPRAAEKLNYEKAPIKKLIENDIKVVLGTDGASPSGIPSIRKEIDTAVKNHGISREYFENNNKSNIQTKTISQEERKEIISRFQDCLESLADKANLKGEIRKEFLESKYKL